MVDYSRWNRIEISDDEDDTHPNIDTGSLFRWRHQARLERMAKHRQKLMDIQLRSEEIDRKLSEIDNEDERQACLAEKLQIDRELSEWKRADRMQPLNVDTISHDSWSKTLINRKQSDDDELQGLNDDDDDNGEITDEHMNKYEKFIEKYEKIIRDFAFHSRFNDTRNLLLDNRNIVNQFTLDYLSLWCIQLKIEQRTELLKHISKQTVLIQMIIDLSKTIKHCDPRDCLQMFFNKSLENWAKFEQLWQQECEDFEKRIQIAANMRIERMIEEQEKQQSANGEKENDKLIGPGGLDVQEVFDSLPKSLQKCFIERDHQMLRETLEQMDPADAEYHMQRCIDAGLWQTERDENEDERRLREELDKISSIDDQCNHNSSED